MQIARTQNEKSVADIVTRVYGLQANDARAAAAAKALLAANPQLSNLSTLPAGTPVVVPPIAGVSAQSSAVANPQSAAWMNTLANLAASAQQASNALATGSAATPAPTPDPKTTAALTLLGQDIDQFKKLHTS